MSSRLKLKYLPKWEVDGYLENFLSAFESSLPLRHPSRLHAEGTMKLIVRLTKEPLNKSEWTAKHPSSLRIR